ncbi:MAG: hypothetical protein SFU27_10920 [Thermonemataceae bacterium]|nr:hypothetical protein [Thermonemataceae bacterium]
MLVITSCKSGNKDFLHNFIDTEVQQDNCILFFISETDCNTCVGYIDEYVKRKASARYIGFYYQKNKKMPFILEKEIKRINSVSWRQLKNADILLYIANKYKVETPMLIEIENRKLKHVTMLK